MNDILNIISLNKIKVIEISLYLKNKNIKVFSYKREQKNIFLGISNVILQLKLIFIA